MREYPWESVDALGFAPIGLDEPYRVFMTKDPLGERADPNLYRFVGNSPNNFVDPLGLLKNNTYPQTDPFWNLAEAHPDMPGVLTLYGHANASQFNGMDAKALAEYITGIKGWQKGMPVRLYGCSAGNGLAQKLSNELQNEVWGPDSPLWSAWNWPTPYPDLTTAPGAGFPKFWDPGSWKGFRNGTPINR